MVRTLLDHKANPERRDDVGCTALDLTVRFEIAELLLKRGANPDSDHNCENPGETLLHSAASWGRQDLIVLLLVHGVDPAVPDITGKTPQELFEEGQDNQGCCWEDLVTKAEAHRQQQPSASFE